ncbi:hypothetical protein VPH35_077427 [Triticum aestivum]
MTFLSETPLTQKRKSGSYPVQIAGAQGSQEDSPLRPRRRRHPVPPRTRKIRADLDRPYQTTLFARGVPCLSQSSE